MLDGWHDGQRVGSGTVIWHARNLMAAGKLDYEGFMTLATASSPSIGHCNTMGTALSMNSLAEALGMSLPTCASIPAPYRERGQMAYATGKRICDMVRGYAAVAHPDPRSLRERHRGGLGAGRVQQPSAAPDRHGAPRRHRPEPGRLATAGEDVPLLANCVPAGEHLGEGFHRAGVPAVLHELQAAGRLHDGCDRVGQTIGEIAAAAKTRDPDVIRSCAQPLKHRAGFIVLSGNFFDSAVIKMSVVGEAFRRAYLSEPGDENAFEARAIVFDGPEDYHARIEDPALNIDEHCILVIRGAGTVGYPGSAEVVNMAPPSHLIKRGIDSLPCLGDGRQSGTSASPSILNMSPEAAVGGAGAAAHRRPHPRRPEPALGHGPGRRGRAGKRRAEPAMQPPPAQTPWQEIYRKMVGQLSTGGCLEPATLYLKVVETRGDPRHSH